MLVATLPAPTACNTPLRCSVTTRPTSAIKAISAVSRPLPRDGCTKGGATTTGGANGKTGAPALSGGVLGAKLGLGGGGGGGALPMGGGADRSGGGGGVGRCEGGAGATEGGGGVGRAEGGGGAERTGAGAGAAVQPGINVARCTGGGATKLGDGAAPAGGICERGGGGSGEGGGGGGGNCEGGGNPSAGGAKGTFAAAGAGGAAASSSSRPATTFSGSHSSMPSCQRSVFSSIIPSRNKSSTCSSVRTFSASPGTRTRQRSSAPTLIVANCSCETAIVVEKFAAAHYL